MTKDAFRVKMYLFTHRRVKVEDINQREINQNRQNNDECKRKETTSGDIFPQLNSVHCCPESRCCQLQTLIACNSHRFPYRRHFMLVVTFLLYSPLFSGSSSFLLLFLSTALQGQDSSPPSVYNFSEFTPFSSSLSRALAVTFPEKINFHIA